MKHTRLLLVGSLLLLLGASEALAQGAISRLVKGASLVIKNEASNAVATAAIQRMLPRIITKDIGISLVASEMTTADPLTNTITIDSVLLPATLSTRMETSFNPVKASPLTMEQMAKLLLKPNSKTLSKLTPQQLEIFFLKGYPATTIEWPVVLTQTQQTKALTFYRQILHEFSTDGRIYWAIDEWAKKMAAITDLGLFGQSLTDADLILNMAKAQRDTSPLCGTTDVIAVRAFLNLKAYEHVQKLADYRLRSGRLSHEWSQIKIYMKQAGLEFNVPREKIVPAGKRPTLADSPETVQWLSFYNNYNVFSIDPSAETTKDFLTFREVIDKNKATAEAQQQVIGELTSEESNPIK